MKRWWISWEEPTPKGDYRPLHVPVPDAVKKWWCSGYGGFGAEDSYATLCAVVDAPTEEEARKAIRVEWEPQEWRFCEECTLDWRPNAGRFPWEDE